MKTTTKTNYYTFLLSLWQINDKAKEMQQASLKDVQNGEKHGFICLEGLQPYLNKITKAWEETSSEGVALGCRDEVGSLPRSSLHGMTKGGMIANIPDYEFETLIVTNAGCLVLWINVVSRVKPERLTNPVCEQ